MRITSLLLVGGLSSLSSYTQQASAWLSSSAGARRQRVLPQPLHATAGSFFNPVPDNNNADADNNDNDNDADATPPPMDFDSSVQELIRQRKSPSLASQPSTVGGKPTAGQGFGNKGEDGDSKPFISIGPRLNDPTKPEYDDQGYTLYANEEMGEKPRVFEALVEYPCDFTMKIVGANEGAFVQEMVAVVAESCQVVPEKVRHTVRTLGKWTSVTVHAPVQSAEMLYQLYENVDRDPRVRFKF